jgi:hypothetical protein
MVNRVSMLLAIWRKLIREADLTVLVTKRQKEPGTGERWRLRFHNHNARFPSSSVSVFEISKSRFLTLEEIHFNYQLPTR